MDSYGYKVMELQMTPPRKMDLIAFNEPESSGGLQSVVIEAAETAKSSGEKDERRGVYSRITKVRSSGWATLLTLKGGSYGELRELFDVDEDDPDAPTRPVMPTDAVLSDFRVLFVIPPYGLSGLIIVETRSRSHLTGQAIRQINSQLMRHGVWLRTRREITDAAAWQQYLSAGNVGVKAVELIQTTQSADRTSFTSENVKRTHVQIDLYDGPHWPAA